MLIGSQTQTRAEKHVYTNIRTDTHTCSEQSLRILMWNASYVPKNIPNKPDRNWLMTSGEKIRNGSLRTDCENRTGIEVTLSKN